MKNEFRSENKRMVTLTRKEEKAVLKIDPSFQLIAKAVYFDNYNLPCPIRVDVRTKSGKTTVVLRKIRHGDVKIEVSLLRVLGELGMPVPKVLTSPFKNEKGEYVAIYSLLNGENLQKLSMSSRKNLEKAKKLLVRGVFKLIDYGKSITRHEISKRIPRHTLLWELENLNRSGTPWHKKDFFKSSIEHLHNILAKIKTPLVFGNGDYQPGNFLVKDGKLTGFLDFESPVFQDPLMGFVKYPIYDLLPLARTDIVDIFLKRAGFSKKDFSSRLALGCLKTLEKEIPIRGGNREMQRYRKRVLGLLKQALKGI